MKTVLSGTTTTATLQLSAEASGPAMLLIGHAPLNCPPKSSATAVAPGATASVEITPVGFGMMRVHVDMANESDVGRLTVVPSGPTDDAIQGDANRPYAVVDQ